MFYIYILYSQTADKYYVGHSSDPWSRLNQHLDNEGDRFTGKYKDWKLTAVFQVSSDRGQAMKIEQLIKRQKSRKLIEKMIDNQFMGTGVLAQLVRVPHLRD